MPVPYLIIFEGRNGSSQLVSLLNAHPKSLCYPEVMSGLDTPGQSEAIAAVAGDRDLRQITAYAADNSFYPQGFERKWEARPFSSVGFKTKVTDFKNIVGALNELEQAGYRLIYLRRANPLKAVLSWINGRRLAEKTQNWNARHPDEVQGPVEIDMDEFRDGLRHRQVIESLHKWFFDTFCGRRLVVTYEEMVGNQRLFLAKIFDFIDSPSIQTAFVGSFLKNTPDSLRAAVVNYEELVREYGETEFARYLD